MEMFGDRARRDGTMLLLLLAPTYLNDFFLIAATTRKEALVIDYVSKALPLVTLIFMPTLWPTIRRATLGRPDWAWTAIFALLTVVVVPLLVGLEYTLSDILPDFRLFDVSVFKEPDWYWFDLSAGLNLNSLSEEFVYRAILAAFLARSGRGPAYVIVMSALIFGGAHWAKGLANIILAVLSGVLFMAMYLRTRSVWPSVVAHTFENLIVFA